MTKPLDPGAGLPPEAARQARATTWGWYMPKSAAERKKLTAMLVLNGLDDEIKQAEREGKPEIAEQLKATKAKALKENDDADKEIAKGGGKP